MDAVFLQILENQRGNHVVQGSFVGDGGLLHAIIGRFVIFKAHDDILRAFRRKNLFGFAVVKKRFPIHFPFLTQTLQK